MRGRTRPMTITASVSAPDTDHGPLPERPQRVLVAEDEHLVATNLTMMLGEVGYTVLLATDGE